MKRCMSRNFSFFFLLLFALTLMEWKIRCDQLKSQDGPISAYTNKILQPKRFDFFGEFDSIRIFIFIYKSWINSIQYYMQLLSAVIWSDIDDKLNERKQEWKQWMNEREKRISFVWIEYIDDCHINISISSVCDTVTKSDEIVKTNQSDYCLDFIESFCVICLYVRDGSISYIIPRAKRRQLEEILCWMNEHMKSNAQA